MVAMALTASAATSSNIVGYVKLNLNKGFSLIANQLDNGALNKVTDLFPIASLPADFSVFKFNGAGFDSVSVVDGAWEGVTTITAAPGEGVFVNNTGAAAVAVTFVGEVKTGTSTVNLPAGFSVVSSVIPQQLTLDAASGFPAANDDSVFRFNGAGYDSDSLVDGAWEGATGGGNPPTVAVGQAFFFRNASAAKPWNRNFTVN